jgi:WD40 repeat protein
MGCGSSKSAAAAPAS